MIRQPAVAGRFYPNDPAELRAAIHEFIEPAVPKVPVIGAVIPHAGYVYSGHVAGSVFSRIQIPKRTIVLCPNHTGLGPPLAIMPSGAWQTPLGTVAIDEELSDALMVADPLFKNDRSAHRHEHAIEVQLPFLQYLGGPDISFVPITVGTANWSHLAALGAAIAEVIRAIDPAIMILASSDMNHYESASVTSVKDRRAIDRVLNLDPMGLYEVIQREHISMCGYGPTTSMLVAAKQLGASKAELVRYGTSGDVSGDFERVVGYAGITVV